MLRVLVPAFLVVLALLVSPAVAQEPDFDIPSVTIAGGELTQSIELAPADADAFRRRVNQLPRLEDEPEVNGPRYRVTSSYWPVAVRLEDEEDVLDVAVQADYFPDGGFVRAEVDGEDVWSVLNLRQRAILDRYIRLAEQGAISDTPSTLDVLAATDEVFGVNAGVAVLDLETARALVRGLAEANPSPLLDPREPAAATAGGIWLVVTLVEGRTLHYYYDGATLTESLGTERYDASSVAETLEGIATSDIPAIVQAEPAGSLLWWPVMLGGGVLAIGVALWLRTKQTSSRSRP